MITARRSIISALALALILFTASCMTQLHPGAANKFDSTTYDALLSAQAAITNAKVQFGADASLKPIINKAIASYNLAENAYVAYHTAAVAGQVPDAAFLTMALSQLSMDIANLKGVKK